MKFAEFFLERSTEFLFYFFQRTFNIQLLLNVNCILCQMTCTHIETCTKSTSFQFFLSARIKGTKEMWQHCIYAFFILLLFFSIRKCKKVWIHINTSHAYTQFNVKIDFFLPFCSMQRVTVVLVVDDVHYERDSSFEREKVEKSLWVLEWKIQILQWLMNFLTDDEIFSEKIPKNAKNFNFTFSGLTHTIQTSFLLSNRHALFSKHIVVVFLDVFEHNSGFE